MRKCVEVFPIISMPDLEVSSPGGLCCCRLVCLLLLAVQPAPLVPHPSSPHVQLAGLAIYMLALVASYRRLRTRVCITLTLKKGGAAISHAHLMLVNYVTG